MSLQFCIQYVCSEMAKGSALLNLPSIKQSYYQSEGAEVAAAILQSLSHQPNVSQFSNQTHRLLKVLTLYDKSFIRLEFSVSSFVKGCFPLKLRNYQIRNSNCNVQQKRILEKVNTKNPTHLYYLLDGTTVLTIAHKMACDFMKIGLVGLQYQYGCGYYIQSFWLLLEQCQVLTLPFKVC